MEPQDYDLRLAESSDVTLPPPRSLGEDFADLPPREPDPADVRLYLPDAEDWVAHIKRDSEKIYCYQKHVGEDYFHLILSGELYLQNGTEKLCLRCALRRGVVTTDRLHWQHRVRRRKTTPM
jgi:hypothetical protein